MLLLGDPLMKGQCLADAFWGPRFRAIMLLARDPYSSPYRTPLIIVPIPPNLPALLNTQ